MEIPAASDGVHLSAYKPESSLSVTNGKATSGGFDEPGYDQRYGDGSSAASLGSDALAGYETLDAPPHYDFYANTEVWGRRRRFRPSLYQLHVNPEVKLCYLSAHMVPISFQIAKEEWRLNTRLTKKGAF